MSFKRLLALCSYPELAAATRFRVAALAPYLESRGISLEVAPFLSDGEFQNFYSSGAPRKTAAIVAGALRRFALALRLRRYHGVLLQREAALIGPPLIEELLANRQTQPVFFDFDDALWLDDGSRSTSFAARYLKWPGKFWRLARSADHVFAGSQRLAQVASTVNQNVSIAPSTVPEREWRPLPGRLEGALLATPAPRIGWIGTHSTATQLRHVLPALMRLRQDGYRFSFRVIGAGASLSPDLRSVEAELRDWELEREVADFQGMDIGLAPMDTDAWADGKCGFKQVQYMAVGVPCVSSFVGGARDFVRDGQNALVATTGDDWYFALQRLLADKSLRATISNSARQFFETQMCTEVIAPRVADVIAERIQVGSRSIQSSAR